MRVLALQGKHTHTAFLVDDVEYDEDLQAVVFHTPNNVVTGLTFTENIEYIKNNYSKIFNNEIRKCIEQLKRNLDKKFCLKYISEEHYNIMLKQIDNILK